MKKRTIFFTAVFLLISAQGLFAQQPQVPQLSIEKGVKKGTLPNGLTYYIRHNEYPKGQVNFHIAQRVGAVQENDNQNGLAHFLEHMCFNGTKNFPDKLILTWLESKGVKFGANVNAHTGADETVYDIMNVPCTNYDVVDSCLLILHDWSSDLTLSTEEINKERGVIHEEWRGRSPFMKAFADNLTELYSGSKYGKHSVIGSMDIVDHCDPQVLRDYYKSWYHPNLQGIVVVGDIDVDKVESKIKEMFSPIENPKDAPKFEYYTVPDNDAPIIISDKEKEMPYNAILVMVKYDLLPMEMRNTDMAMVFDYSKAIISDVISQRLSDISLKSNAPFSDSSFDMDTYLYSSTKGAAIFQFTVNNSSSNALESVLTEIKRAGQYGITAGEYERARNEYLSRLEKKYNERDKEKSETYAQEYVQNFLWNSRIPGIEYEYTKMKAMAPMIPIAAINQVVQNLFNGKNMVVLSVVPDKTDVNVPTTQEMLASYNKVEASKVEAYKDNAINEPLISSLPTPGKIISEKENKKLGYNELKLSNGVKVLLKQTTFKNDEILMSVVGKGGASLYSAKDYPSIVMLEQIAPFTGISKFSNSDLQKLLSGKQVSVSPYIRGYEEGIDGKTSVKDLETMMQLLYVVFTQPRYNKQEFETIKGNLYESFKNYDQYPQYVMQDSVIHALYNNNPKAMIIGKKMISEMDYDRMHQIYKEIFANASNFTFIFSGNFDNNLMKKYVEQYIASLPSNGKIDKEVNDGKTFVKGQIDREFKFKSQDKKAMLSVIWSGDMPYNMKNDIKTKVLSQLMTNNLLNNVRENEGAAYSPMSMGELEKTYEDKFIIETFFGLNPDKKDISKKLTIDALESLAKNIPEKELDKMKEYMVKKFDENNQENKYWIDIMKDYSLDGIDMFSNYKAEVMKLTPKEMQDFDASILKQNNRVAYMMLPD